MALAGLIIVFAVTRPLGSLVSVLQRMARGEIDATIAEARRGDEIGAVGKAVQGIKDMVARKAAEEAEVKRRADEAAAAERKRTMVELADGFERAVGGIVGLVSSSATELEATAQQMTATATETANQSTTVAAAAEEAATNVNTVVAAAARSWARRCRRSVGRCRARPSSLKRRWGRPTRPRTWSRRSRPARPGSATWSA